MHRRDDILSNVQTATQEVQKNGKKKKTQENIFQIKEQDNYLKTVLNEMEINNIPDQEFKPLKDAH